MADTKKIDAVSGQSVQIVLQSAPGSTGYSWYLTELDGGLALSGAYAIPPATPMPGAPSNQVFDFLATAPGKYKVAFTLLAPWRVTEAADTELYEVEITAPAKTAAEDIASAMKGREFVRASSVNLGSAPSSSTVLKYAAPMAISNPMSSGPATQVIYAAPMAQAISGGPFPQVIYAAPMAQATTYGAFPQVIYAAPMAQSIVAGPIPQVIYAAPMTQVGQGMSPAVVYAAPMAQSGTVAAQIPGMQQALMFQQQPNVIYAAPMTQAGMFQQQPNVIYAAPMNQAAMFQQPIVVYAAPMAQFGAYGPQAGIPSQYYGFGGAQPLYAAPMASTVSPMMPMSTVIMYAAPVSSLYSVPMTAAGYAAAMMQPYAAPYTLPMNMAGYGAAMMQPYAAPYTGGRCC